jgi:hypothetical protein
VFLLSERIRRAMGKTVEKPRRESVRDSIERSVKGR